MNYKAKALAAALALGMTSGVMAQDNQDHVNINYVASDSAGLFLDILQNTDVDLLQGDGTGTFVFCVASLNAPSTYSVTFDSTNALQLAGSGEVMNYTASVNGNTTADLALTDGGTEMDETEITVNSKATCDAADTTYSISIDADESQAVAGVTYTDIITLTVTSS